MFVELVVLSGNIPKIMKENKKNDLFLFKIILLFIYIV
jgi:hypothetical protein